MTRCFGWTLPSTMIVPFADFHNHSDSGCSHYIINTKFEENEQQAPKNYLVKKRTTDLSIFGNDNSTLSQDDKKTFFAPLRWGYEYIKQNLVK